MISKKLSLLCILDILKEYSDENHPLTQNDIVNLMLNNYGLDYERKSVGYNIEDLIEYGIDIIKVPHKGVYLASRAIEPSELTFIADALFSSRSVSGKHAKQIAFKLSKELSKYQQSNYKYIYKADQIIRTNNKELFYTIEVLQEAIEKGKKVSFKYDRPFFEREKNSLPYIISPYFLINNQGRYYLVCNNDKFQDISNYKVERIYDIKLLKEDAKPVKEIKGYELGIDIAKYANEHIYMFGNETVDATLKLKDEHSVGYVVDWFGENARFYKKDGVIYADVKSNEQALVIWCLQYADNCKLIYPKRTMNEIIKRVNKIKEVYKE